jgi:anti-sigma factor RsiW
MNPLSNEQDFRRRLNMYLDGALDKEEEREFLNVIRSSPQYLSELQHEQSFREFLRQKLSRKTVSPALVQSIKSKINLTPHATS